MLPLVIYATAVGAHLLGRLVVLLVGCREEEAPARPEQALAFVQHRSQFVIGQMLDHLGRIKCTQLSLLRAQPLIER